MQDTRAPEPHIEGRVAPGFEPVRDAFAHNFAAHGEVGAAVCVYRDGEPVVDLWGGLADREAGRAWQRDTLALVFSTTKGVTAACSARLAERGVLDVDAPVARYWPEFAANGKAGIRVADVLAHRAGLPEVEGRFTLEQACAGDPLCEALAKQAPQWPPGTAHGYHVRTFGWILGEVVRRATGERFGRVLARELAAPLGLERDLFVGLPAEHDARTARILPAPEPADPKERELRARFMGPDTVLGRMLSGPSHLFEYGEMWNTRLLRGAEMPSSNGIATARALAHLYAALVGPSSPQRQSTASAPSRSRDPIACCSCPRASASASPCPPCSPPSARRAASAIRVQAARWPSRIRTRASASATR
jgi:CubicO group peptidase (beta-lactamase class C family)